MSTQRPLTELVIAARDGDSAAWESLVECYAGLVWWVCRRHRLSDSDAADVSQTVWLRLVEHLPSLREPKALPGWLDATARHECLRLLRTRQRQCWGSLEAELVDLTAGPDEHALDEELHAALRQAFQSLPARCQRLLLLLMAEPISYDQVCSTLQMPLGSVGPTRARCLDKLRRSPALAAFLAAAQGVGSTGPSAQRARP